MNKATRELAINEPLGDVADSMVTLFNEVTRISKDHGISPGILHIPPIFPNTWNREQEIYHDNVDEIKLNEFIKTINESITQINSKHYTSPIFAIDFLTSKRSHNKRKHMKNMHTIDGVHLNQTLSQKWLLQIMKSVALKLYNCSNPNYVF